MNEIKKCPFCEQDAYAEISVNDGYVKALVMCKGCGVRYETVVPLNKYSHISIVIEHAFSIVLEQWNKRAEEPQERKETRFERLLKEEQRADKLVCCLAYRDKYKGKDCATEICGECEFCDCENAINYLLAPCEGKDDLVAVSDLISKTQSSANEILEALRANTKKHE